MRIVVSGYPGTGKTLMKYVLGTMSLGEESELTSQIITGWSKATIGRRYRDTTTATTTTPATGTTTTPYPYYLEIESPTVALPSSPLPANISTVVVLPFPLLLPTLHSRISVDLVVYCDRAYAVWRNELPEAEIRRITQLDIDLEAVHQSQRLLYIWLGQEKIPTLLFDVDAKVVAPLNQNSAIQTRMLKVTATDIEEPLRRLLRDTPDLGR